MSSTAGLRKASWRDRAPCLEGDTNLYAYVGGDPIDYTDPTGLQACSDNECSSGPDFTAINDARPLYVVDPSTPGGSERMATSERATRRSPPTVPAVEGWN